MKRKGHSIAIAAVLLLSIMVVMTLGQAAARGLAKSAPADCPPPGAWFPALILAATTSYMA